MKRFYKEAGWDRDGEGDGGLRRILLDGRTVKTPAREALAVPGDALAKVIAAEWNGQGETIDAATMPMTGFANATIDRVLPDVADFIRLVGAYAASDLLCYRASDPAELVALQANDWDPLLNWARARYDVAFTVTDGIMPVDQPAETVERFHGAVALLDPWVLAAFYTIVSLGGTLVGAFALLEGAIDGPALWDATRIDEDWQARHWGNDDEAVAQEMVRRKQFDEAVHYCGLVMSGNGALQA